MNRPPREISYGEKLGLTLLLLYAILIVTPLGWDK